MVARPYAWKSRHQGIKIKPDVAMTELGEMAKKMGHPVRPEDLVREARSTKSPFHSSFEWDDGIAAQRYRIWQARFLLCKILVRFDDPKTGEVVETRAMVRIYEENGEGDGYESIVTVMNDADRRAAFLAQAMKEMMEWQRRYQTLSELQDVFAAIQKVKSKRRVNTKRIGRRSKKDAYAAA